MHVYTHTCTLNPPLLSKVVSILSIPTLDEIETENPKAPSLKGSATPT